MEDDDSDSSLDESYIFYYDIFKKQIIIDCLLNPTEVTREDVEWLCAGNNKYTDYDSKKVGKWMIFPPEDQVNSLWSKIKEAIKIGDLWQSKVSPSDPPNGYAIMIYTVDYTDKKDVIDALNYLEKSGIKPANRVIKYKTDQQTRAGIYAGGTQKSSIYASNTIREESSDNRLLYTFAYDILKNQIIDDCSLNPTEVTREKTDWLHAVNNKYDNKVESIKVGKWMIFPPKDDVNSIWNKVKEGIKAGDLWKSKVSTADASNKYVIMIFTKDYTDRKDVVNVLNYLEMSGIKPTHTVVKYKTNEQTRAGIIAGGHQKASIYASNTIQKNCRFYGNKTNPISNWRTPADNGASTSSNTIQKNYGFSGNKTNTITNWRTPSHNRGNTSSNTTQKNYGFYENKTNTITNWRTPSDNGTTTSSKTSHP